MGGVDTVRGIAYQQAQAVLAALDVLDDLDLEGVRVEGLDDIVDIELFAAGGTVHHAKQVKVRAEQYTWGEAEIVAVLRRWADLPSAVDASFEFLTDGRLGPSGESLRAALEEAACGRREALASILHEDTDSPRCVALARARVSVDSDGVEALLSRAERQVAAILPSARTTVDAFEQAQRAVGALFRLLFDRGGERDAQARVISRERIAATLGVPADQPGSQRWPGGVRERYLEAARALSLDAVVPILVEAQGRMQPAIRRLDVYEDGESLDCSVLLAGRGPVTLSGRTGTGKSVTARNLCHTAAMADRVVLLAHAETYLPGRLDALAADALSALLDDELPSATGRQVLADRGVTLVIDGVSEVPASKRNALYDDLVAPVAAGRGANIVLLGRDIAALREVLPSSVAATSYQMVDLNPDRRYDLARRILLDPSPVDDTQHGAALELRTVVARVEHALGDAAGNPLLFTMGLTLVARGIPFTDRATLYDAFVENLAERSGATEIVTVATALGIVYARLLDQGRRYASPYEWARLVADAGADLSAAGLSADPHVIDAAARRSGLIAPIGYTQTLAPIHDSFADYLAGIAHAQGLAVFPAQLQHGDDQRVLFAAEIGGVDAALAALVARDQPFLTVRLAKFDHRDLTQDAPTEVETLLHRLLPEPDEYPVALLRAAAGDQVIAVRHNNDGSAWADEASTQRLLEAAPAVVVENGGALAVAARLWRQDLIARLRTPQALGAPRPNSLEEASSALAAHASETAAATDRLIEAVAPPGHKVTLAARVGPVGLSASVHPATHALGGVHWPMSYRHTKDVRVMAAPIEEEGTGDAPLMDGWGSSTVEVQIADTPAAAAAKRVQAAINDLTVQGWL